ncbi:hypothetical protein A0J57_23175 [Sphingobium sp. 22B]|uniref:hypothetical protein n=1 Tax=unclassified Sphingobium TaxID=2611147 RepID=UPI0007817F0E|nr:MULTISPECIES: hypothetical protein [unclassified Sphingobium]KXU29479.1 hypothetical protein AXW74_22785 [Sphingobium sp. AM]KYC29969.1 hypothetical protein A0J57_23175 [Sphingobium sp. 22B]
MTDAEVLPDQNSASDADLFKRLRGLMRSCQSEVGKHDQAIIVIAACIEEGLDTRPRIVGAMKKLGFNSAHVAITLNKATGSDLERHRWRLDGAGRYSLLS